MVYIICELITHQGGKISLAKNMNYKLNTKLKAENLSGKKYVSEIELQIENFSEKSLLVFGWVGVEWPFYVSSTARFVINAQSFINF